MSVEVVYEMHSTSEDKEAGIATGWLPGRFSAVGREQGRELLPRISDERLRECDYGDLNGTSQPINEDRTGRIDLLYPSGETWRQAVERVTGFYEELRRERVGERVLVIGHAATRWALEVGVRGRPIEEVVAEEFVWQPGWEYVL